MDRRLRLALAAGLVSGLALASCEHEAPVPESCFDGTDRSHYDERIAPLFEDDHPSTCNECHLAGVALGLYAQGDECQTMACMVQEGIVDLDEPDQSVVLDWITRGTPDSELITEEVIQAEHDAMLEWIEYHSTCNRGVCEHYENPCGDGPNAGMCDAPPSGHDLPPREFDDPGDCSDKTLEIAFDELVYSWRGRCAPCHYDSNLGSPEDAPRWIAIGECKLGALATMRNVIDTGLVDASDPANSLLLLKPLAESIGGVEHGGGDKFETTDDGAYQDFRRWIDRWAACQGPPD